MLLRDCLREVIERLVVGRLRRAQAIDRRQYLDFELRNHRGDLLHSPAAPTVRANNRGELRLGPEGVSQEGGIGDGRVRTSQDGRRADDNGSSVDEGGGQLANVELETVATQYKDPWKEFNKPK